MLIGHCSHMLQNLVISNKKLLLSLFFISMMPGNQQKPALLGQSNLGGCGLTRHSMLPSKLKSSVTPFSGQFKSFLTGDIRVNNCDIRCCF